MVDALLRLQGIRKAFPGTQALGWEKSDVMEIYPGEIHGLVGENGAGKSTLFQVMMGIYLADDGEMTFLGSPYAPRTTHDAERFGVSIIMQQPNTFENMTVAENIFVGRDIQFQTNFGVLRTRHQIKAAQQVLEECGFGHIVASKTLRDLSFEQRKEVEIARALSVKPKILLVDETSAAVSREAVETLYSVVREQRDRGVSVIYISHFIEEVFELCRRVTVLRDGHLINTHRVSEIGPDRLIEDMVGRQLTNTTYRTETPYDRAAPVLVAKGLSGERFEGIDLELRSGEIVGIAGIGGCGSDDFGRALFGACPVVGGEMELLGEPVVFHSPGDALSHGVGFIPKDRDREGLVGIFDLVDNISSANLKKMSRFGWMQAADELKTATDFIDTFRIKTPKPHTPVASLSGGNRQKVVMAKWVANNCAVLIVNSPTRGVDVGAKYEIYKILDELRMEGKALMVVSDELPELTGLCDRLYTFRSGRISGVFERSGGFPVDAILAGMVSGDGGTM
jgi:ABC-type sugar transport system ATPase subunit